ncbi:Uncharacterized conserved protein, DUF2147 family [Shimia gijangensis]|uniref:Uncharacterized conserved protein, DUF2147 family n=1 Tax=Shimia gijangensis TaxID=1470563 RepID=A0A1M6SPX8_9RHOB|nr:DUF2147 domain-containing protein [Shimia gijangensis]SHK46804.1 Uncharacterized conserved protein, DUF2147 family [Shimia gijangensis]
MKKLLLAASLAIVGAGAALADPAEGMWKTEPGETGGYLHVNIATCGAALCGTIAAAYDKSGSKSSDYEHMGKKLLWGMNADGGGKYSGGKIWAPDTDKTYKSKMSLSGSTLSVRGFVGVSAFGRSQDWKRVN